MPRNHGQAKQTRLSFTPVTDPLPNEVQQSPGSTPERLAHMKYERPSGRRFRQDQRRLDEYSTAAHGTPSSVTSSRSGSKKDEALVERVTSNMGAEQSKVNKEEKGEQHAPPPTNTASHLESTPTNTPTPNDPKHELSSEEDVIPFASAAKNRRRPVVADDSDSESSSQETNKSGTKDRPSKNVFTSPSTFSGRKLRSRKSANNTTPTSSDSPASRAGTRRASRIQSEKQTSDAKPLDHTSPSGSDSRPRTRQSLRGRNKQKSPDNPPMRDTARRPSNLNLSQLGSAETSDADELVTLPTSRKRKPPVIILSDHDSDSSEDLISSPVKRRRRLPSEEGPRTPRKHSQQDKMDLEEDLLDLQDSAVQKTRTRGRIADSARSERQKQLEILRRRRAGQKGKGTSDIEEEGRDNHGSQHDFENDSDDMGLSDSEGDYKSNIESDMLANEDLDAYEDDFIEEDEGALGVPTDLSGLPFEFTRHAYKKPKECFKDVVDWMVHNRLNPAFPRKDEIYESAFQKLEDEVRGRSASQLISSAWNRDFHYALKARPQMEVRPFPTEADHPCDACNRSGHPASADIQLYGKAYSLDTLEPLDDEDEDSDEVDDDDESRIEQAKKDGRELDREGHVLPDEDRRFLVGRHCRANAETAHTLLHWRYHLNEWVIDYLENQGILSDEQILQRSRWSQKKQAKHANEVVDTMEAAGEIKRLWRDFHFIVKDARDTKESRWL